jgi:hypothetical protein
MSILRVANVHFEATGSSRIDLVNDTINIVAGGSVVLSANQSEGIIVGKTNVAPAFDQANAAYAQANTAETIAVSSFAKANIAVVNVQSFDSSGTWNKPLGYADTSRVHVQMWSAGGSGARGRATSTDPAVGGCGGGYAEFWYDLSTLGSTENITVGAGGASITSGNTSGANGGSSVFGSYLSVSGGEGGRYNPAVDFRSNSGGLFIGSVNFTITVSGPSQEGRSGYYFGGCEDTAQPPSAGFYRGGGGGFAAPGMSQGSLGIANGAISYYGGGGGGAFANLTISGIGGVSAYGGRGGNAATNFITAGQAGQTPGGGGGTSSSNNAGAVSGAGGNGKIIITVFPA